MLSLPSSTEQNEVQGEQTGWYSHKVNKHTCTTTPKNCFPMLLAGNYMHYVCLCDSRLNSANATPQR